MELTISIIGAAVAIIVSVLGAYFAIKSSIILQNRKLKEGHYVSYIEALHNYATDNQSVKYKSQYTFCRDRLLLIANESVIIALLDYEANLKSEKTNEYLSRLIKAIRADLELSNRKIPTIFLVK